ncbi:hypothetical protein OS493_039552, partial [Desmophyllum pertusum]
MACLSPLVLVAELDGFKHGQETFTPKCLAIVCDRLEFAYDWIFNTGSLASRSIDHLSTYHYQSTFIHGMSLTSPGLPLDLFSHVFRHTMDHLLLEVFQAPVAVASPDQLLIFTK